MRKYLLSAIYIILLIAVIIILSSYMYLTNEDSYIGFQYMKNFSNGYGFVVNPGGATQEGFSNLAVVMIIGFLNKIFGFDIMYASKILGILSVLAMLFINFLIFKQLIGLIETKHKKLYLHALNVGSIITIGFSPYVALWATQGLETMFYAAIIVLIVYLTLYSILNGKYRYFNLIALASFFSLTIRPEGLMNFFVFLVVVIVWMIINRKISKDLLINLVASVAIFLGLMIALIVWKILYFGDFVSNPTYIKLSLKEWHPIITYTYEYFKIKGSIFNLVLVFGVIGTIAMFIRAIVKGKNKKLTIILITLLGFIGSQIFFTLYSRGDYMAYFRFFVTHYGIMVLLILIAPFILASIFDQKYRRIMIIISILALTFSITFNEKINDLTWKERDYISPHKSVKETIQYQMAQKLNGILEEDELYATSEYGIIPYYTKAIGLDMAGLNEKTVARSFKYYDIDNAVIAIRDFVLSKKPKLIITWGHHLNENGELIINPAVAWFLSPYYKSDFFLKNYDVNTPKKEGEWGIHIWNNSYKPTDKITQEDRSNYDKLLFGFFIEENQIWTQPLARVLLEPKEGQTEIIIKGFIPDINLFENKQNIIEIRYNNMAVGNEILSTHIIKEAGTFEIRSTFNERIFPANEGALITIKSNQFQVQGDERALSFVLESIQFK